MFSPPLNFPAPLEQDDDQTYARTRLERGFFLCPFSPQTQETKQKMARNGTFLSLREARLRESLVIFPSDRLPLSE